MKNERQKTILKIVGNERISTLKQLKSILCKDGFDVDTATLSRDIREIGIVRTTENGNAPAYRAISNIRSAVAIPSKGIINKFVKSMDWTDNMVVIKTFTGTASTVSEIIDGQGWKEVCGTIAGDNTIFIAVSRGTKPQKLMAKIREELINNYG